MATYDDLVTNLKLQWIDTEDVAATQRAIIEVTPDGASMELPRGLRGEKGEKGDTGAAPMFRHLVTSFADLPKDLTAEDQGASFPDVGSRSLWVWTGSDYFEVPNFIGLKGETGATPELAVGDVTMGGEARFSVNVSESTPERVVFDVQLPQGPQGPQGIQGPPGPTGPASDSAKITESPDYDNSTTPTVGDTIVWNGSKWQADTVTLNASDVGAAPTTHTHTKAQISDLPTISVNSYNGHIVQRQTNGHIQVPPSPSANTDAASKGYVDQRVLKSGTATTLWSGTQAEYDALPTGTRNAAGFIAVIV